MADTFEKRMGIFLILVVALAIISSNEKALFAIGNYAPTLAVGLQDKVKYDPLIPYSDISSGLNAKDWAYLSHIYGLFPLNDGSLDILGGIGVSYPIIVTRENIDGHDVKIIASGITHHCSTGYNPDLPYGQQIGECQHILQSNPTILVGEWDIPTPIPSDLIQKQIYVSVPVGGLSTGTSNIVEIVHSNLKSGKFEVFSNGVSLGVFERQNTNEPLRIGLNVGRGSALSPSGSYLFSTQTLRIKSFNWNPSLGCDIRKDDVVVSELLSNDKPISIHDLRYAFPNGGFRKFCAELPPVILAKGMTGADTKGEMLAELVSGREIDLNSISTPTVKNVEAVQLFYIVDNSDHKITTGCDYTANGEVYDAKTGVCSSKNAIAVAIGGGAVIDIEKGTVALGEKPPCDVNSGLNLFSTSAKDGNCPSSEWTLLGNNCFVCKEFISQGGICAGSVNDAGECEKKPNVKCPEGTVGTTFDSSGSPTTCTLTAENAKTVLPIQQLNLENAKQDAINAVNPKGMAQERVVAIGKGYVFPATIIAIALILVAVIIRRFMK